MTPFGISGLLAGISSLGLGIFVFLKGQDRGLAKRWFLFTLSVAGYGFSVAGIGWTTDPHLALNLWRTGYLFGVIWIAPLFYHFVRTFLNLKESKTIQAHYFIALAFVPILPTTWFFKQVDWIWESVYFARSGVAHYLFFIWWSGLVIYSHYLLIRAYRNIYSTKRNQIKYFFAATAIGYCGGSLSYLPNFGVDFYPWGNFGVFLYPIIMSYAILKHHLMDINVVIRKTFLYAAVSSALTIAYAGLVTTLVYLIGSGRHVSEGISIHGIANQLQASFSYTCTAGALLSVGLGLFVLSRGPRKPINRLWCAMCLSVAIWSFSLGMMVNSSNQVTAYRWQQVLYFGAIWIPVVFLHFVSLVTSYRIKRIFTVAYVVAVIQHIFNITDVLATVGPTDIFNYYTVALPSYPIYFAYFVIVVVYAHFLLFKKMFESQGQLKEQVKYIALGTLIGFCGGSTTFFLAFGIPVFPYGVYAVPIYTITVSYAIYRHHLMDINVVIRKTLVYSLLTAALAAVYVGTITLLAHILGGHQGTASAFSAALAAIFITLLFNPVHIRIQRFVDRHFFREAVDQTVLREITGAFVHEIKMPLSNIALPAELTLMDMEDLQRGKKVSEEFVVKIKKRMEFIMNQALLAGSKVEAVREATVSDGIAQGVLDLKLVIHNSLKQMEDQLRHSLVKVHLNIPPLIENIPGSAKQLEIVFANLLKNAAEAMEELPRNKAREINIHADVNDGYVVVQVSDTGPGVKPEDADRIFQSHYTTKGSRGAGMGLHLSRQIIQAHGGNIGVVDIGKPGATFEIQLPKNGIGAK